MSAPMIFPFNSFAFSSLSLISSIDAPILPVTSHICRIARSKLLNIFLYFPKASHRDVHLFICSKTSPIRAFTDFVFV
jgi:hypothetical protein